MNVVQECDRGIDVQRRCPGRCAVLENQTIVFCVSKAAIHCDSEASGAVSTSLDVNVRSVASGQGVIVVVDGVQVQRVDCGVTQGEAIVVGVVNTDIDRDRGRHSSAARLEAVGVPDTDAESRSARDEEVADKDDADNDECCDQ